MKAQTYLNEGEGRFWRYTRDDLLVTGPEVEIPDDAVRELGETTVAEAIWAVGNRVGADVSGVEWPSNVRSLSVGDVMVVGEAAFAVDHFGVKPITSEDLQHSLEHGRARPRGRIVR